MQGDAEQKAVDICKALKSADSGIHIWGGETSLILPSSPGRGGRNQHLAAVAARELAGVNDIVFLAAGTDGLVDGQTVSRGKSHNLDISEYLEAADVGNYLVKTGDLVTTGPTGTNVMDLIIALKK